MDGNIAIAMLPYAKGVAGVSGPHTETDASFCGFTKKSHEAEMDANK